MRRTEIAHILTLFGILVAAAAIRVFYANTNGLWTDESLTLVIAHWPFRDLLFQPVDETPGLYYILQKLFLSSNSSIFALRSISIIAGVASVGAMYALGRVCFGKAGGLLASAMLAVWFAHVDYSEEARAYSLLFLFTLLTSLGLVFLGTLDEHDSATANRSRKRQIALFLIAFGNIFSFYTHITSVFWIFTSLIFLPFMYINSRKPLKREFYFLILIMLIFASPGLYRLFIQLKIGDDFHWLPQADLAQFGATILETVLPINFGEVPEAVPGSFQMFGLLAVVSVALAMIMAFRYGARPLISHLRAHPMVLAIIVAYLVMPIAIWVFGFYIRPIFLLRTILFCLPGFILLLSGLCILGSGPVPKYAGVGIVFIYGISTLLFCPLRQKEDWRGAYRYLSAHASQDDILVLCPAHNYPALRYPAKSGIKPALLLVTSDSRFQLFGGTNENDESWDLVYYRKFLVPKFRRRLGERSPGERSVPSLLRLHPGESVWRVDGHCQPALGAKIGKALENIDPAPSLAWYETTRSTYAIKIWRYRTSSEVNLPIVN